FTLPCPWPLPLSGVAWAQGSLASLDRASVSAHLRRMSRKQPRSKVHHAVLLVAVPTSLALVVATTAAASAWNGDAERGSRPAADRADEAKAAAETRPEREASPLAKLDAPAADAPLEGTVAERLGAGP